MATGFLIDADPTAEVVLPDNQRRPALFRPSKEKLLVSCVMVSRGNVEILRHSVDCFLRQTYENLELVVILPDISHDLRSYFDSLKGAGRPMRIHTVPAAALTLGDLRNMAIARSRGRIICQWDDDDLHHSRYVDYMVGFMEANEVGSTFLIQCTMWWPNRRQFALSKIRLLEGSVVAGRSLIPIYPRLGKGEDTFVMSALRRRAIVAVRAPQLYVYTVTGENTWDEQHLERLSEGGGAARCADEDYDPIFARLDSLYGVADYQSYCLRARRIRESQGEWSSTSSM
jgi:glycosyltransferase involved in cell wall biosynthesis